MRRTDLIRRASCVGVMMAVLIAGRWGGAQDYTPQYGLHTDYGLVMGYPSWAEFVQAADAKGFSAIMYMALVPHPVSQGGDGSVDLLFASPTLEALGFAFYEDHVSELVAEAAAYNIDVFVDVQTLSYVGLRPEDNPLVTPPSPADLANVVNELAAYGIAGISEEMFLAEWYEPVHQACQAAGLTYIHKAISWDFGATGHYWGTTVFDVYPHCDVLMTEDYNMALDPPMIAAYEQFPSIAEVLGREYHIKLSPAHWALQSVTNMENVMLLKAVQSRPEYIYVMTWNKPYVDTSDFTEMTGLIQEYARKEAKPICNVVLHLTGDEPPDTWDWWEFPCVLAAISTGAKASGYDIVTTRTPIDHADVYYVVTRGAWGNWAEPMDIAPILPLFDSGKPVFLQVTHVLPYTTPDWQLVRTMLGIDVAEPFDLPFDTGVSVEGQYGGVAYTHLRGSTSDHLYLNAIEPGHVTTGEVLATGNFLGAEYAFIVRNGNNYFVNGTNLDLRASFPISNLLNDGLQKPAACVANTGNTSVFYALEDTDLHVKLPNRSATEVEWFRRDFDGVASSGIAPYDAGTGYVDALPRGTLLILRVNPSLDILDLWTSDCSGVRRTEFSPGEEVQYNLDFTFAAETDRKVIAKRGKAKGKKVGGGKWKTVLHKRKEILPPGFHRWSWCETVPLNAAPGKKATVRIQVKVKGVGTQKAKAKFAIVP